VLDTEAVNARLDMPGVVRMRGDWTLPSDAISTYLAGFGRYGIPFNAVYGPGAPEGVALPEILTRDAVLAALEQAAGSGTATSAQSLK
jgi:suppressor for copper-sensitivity B